MRVMLRANEMEILFRQDPAKEGKGGYQQFLVSLQKRVNRATGEIDLSDRDLARIPKYSFKYGRGGWEDRFVGIFGRALGAGLGREHHGY